jgi:hypothetical protein
MSCDITIKSVSFEAECQSQTHPPRDIVVRAPSGRNMPPLQPIDSKQDSEVDTYSRSDLDFRAGLEGHAGFRGLFENRFM